MPELTRAEVIKLREGAEALRVGHMSTLMPDLTMLLLQEPDGTVPLPTRLVAIMVTFAPLVPQLLAQLDDLMTQAETVAAS